MVEGEGIFMDHGVDLLIHVIPGSLVNDMLPTFLLGAISYELPSLPPEPSRAFAQTPQA